MKTKLMQMRLWLILNTFKGSKILFNFKIDKVKITEDFAIFWRRCSLFRRYLRRLIGWRWCILLQWCRTFHCPLVRNWPDAVSQVMLMYSAACDVAEEGPWSGSGHVGLLFCPLQSPTHAVLPTRPRVRHHSQVDLHFHRSSGQTDLQHVIESSGSIIIISGRIIGAWSTSEISSQVNHLRGREVQGSVPWVERIMLFEENILLVDCSKLNWRKWH